MADEPTLRERAIKFVERERQRMSAESERKRWIAAARIVSHAPPIIATAVDAAQMGEASERETPLSLSVSDDYRSIKFKGQTYRLTRSQSQMFKVLYAALQKGHPDVDKDALLKAIQNETSRVRDTWRKSPLWKTLIVSQRKGTYRLQTE